MPSRAVRAVRAGASTPSTGAGQSNYNMRLSVPYMLVASLLTGVALYMATHVIGQNSSYGMSSVGGPSPMISWKVYAAVALMAGVFHFAATLASQIGCTTDIKEDAGWTGLQAVGMIAVTWFTLFGLNLMIQGGSFSQGSVTTAFIMMIVLPMLWWGVSLFFNFLIMLGRGASDKCP